MLKTITRSPIVIKELLAVAEDLRKGARSIKEIVQFDDEELTEEKIENKTRQTLKVLDKIGALYDVGAQAGRQAGGHAEVQEAPLPARALRGGAHAHRDVATGALARVQPASSASG